MPGVLTAGVYEGVCRVPGSGALGISFLKEYAECQDLGHSALFFLCSITSRYCAVGPVDKVAECPLYDTRQLFFSPSVSYKTLGKINRYFMLHRPPS